ncbi:MAG: hypothetical protein ACXVS6_22660 [Solirubrobacteraceae bacterium]
MGTTQCDRQRPRRPPPPRATARQRQWIECRDRIGLAVDAYLRTAPPREMRDAIIALEAALALGDRVVGLL